MMWWELGQLAMYLVVPLAILIGFARLVEWWRDRDV